jgi:excisionase family DNA binding protein
MTRSTRATRRDEHATSLVAPSSRARRAPQPSDQAERANPVARDERDDEFAHLTSPAPKPRTVSPSRRSNRSMATASTPARRLLTVAEVAERLGTTERFPRRLIAERRITFVKLGSHVRIPEAALDEMIAASTVQAAE